MAEWRARGESSRIRVEARPPFIRIEEVYTEGPHPNLERSLIAEAVVAVDFVPQDPQTYGPLVCLKIRDSHQSKHLHGLTYYFDDEDEARCFENDLTSALAHAGNWRRR